MRLLIALIAMICTTAQASDWNTFNLNELALNYRNYGLVNPNGRNLLIYPTHPKEGIDVGLKIDVVTYFYWDSDIESLTSGSKYESIGLQTRLGFRLTDYVQLGFWHHSQHNLERPHAFMTSFPSEDAFEVRLYIYRARGQRTSLF